MLQQDNKQPTYDEIRKSHIEDKYLDKSEYPCLRGVSSGYIYNYQPVPKIAHSPEYIHVPEASVSDTESHLFMLEWNLCWESAQLRYDIFNDTKKIPKKFKFLEKYKDKNIFLLPDKKNFFYSTYQSLYHVIPKATLEYYNLPLYKRGVWPESWWGGDPYFLNSTEIPRFHNAFSNVVWPFLNDRTPQKALSRNESIKILAHNLDFWLPYFNMAIQDRLSEYERCSFKNAKQKAIVKELKNDPMNQSLGIDVVTPRKGGYLWMGEDDAQEFVKEVVEKADHKGNLRAIVDTIKSNRVEDDFSDMWSYEREDFERKLYAKRIKMKVSFVELKETIPTHSNENQIIDNMFWDDFAALLDEKNKQIVVLLRSGQTNLTNIASELGFKNHSAISKRIRKIRSRLEQYMSVK